MSEIEGEIELKERRKISPELREIRNKMILKNLWIAIFIMIYLLFLNLGNYNIDRAVFTTDLHVFSVAILVLAIYLFEKGYKKDDEGIFLNGVEALVLAVVTLIMPYTMFEASKTIHVVASLSFVYFTVYYLIKSLVQAIKQKKKYSTSDVRELVKNTNNKEN